MADFPGKSDAPSFTAPAANTQKRTGPNISSSWVIMLLSGLIAMIVFLAATAKPSANVAVVAAADDIPTGAQITEDAFKSESVSLGSAQLGRFIRWSDRQQYVGAIAAGPLAAGDLIAKSQLRKPPTTNSLAAMSIPVDETHATGGDLAIGDRVNVLDETTGSFAAVNVEVIAVNKGAQGGALAATQSFHITVAVSPDQAIAIGTALKNQKLDIVRTTGMSQPTAKSTVTTTTSTTAAPAKQ